ncbi:LysR family transcriptional regulator [Marinomonas mediterranea]|jgi:transcriptional regulator, LysR family|uniref:Transcriptional regulator, LysR family n=1 Tax=Marinomonas mediterranea (strain ATCC 700492 / JCM 21426 / NBRC 103028 / MMB-1) TaxID=717774 RepID=F2JVL3_MARM1|nr:LysR family transcriptional regulator [Marinomonas mediterranea]ADZ90557.1 transcriptional regulator, LysR family [Marinomonas mediterranea MMB-1]WCN08605.1 LysR family transcriptional regulator [Marinomonas mediterranea]WCN16733.1 LysR family transcriptional regulator [Marinomonas mediterranea MMB-1]
MTPQLIPLLPDLATFILIVNEGSFTAASHKLGVTPSALSKLITRLEKALSVKLLERSTRKLVITATGQKIYDQCLVMTNAAQNAVELSDAEHSEAAGELTVAAPEAFLFSVIQPLVVPFLIEHPNIQLKLRVADGHIDILNDKIDIAFRLTDQPDENQVMKDIGKTALMVCASPEYLSSKGTPKHPNDLTKHDCLYLAENDKDNIWTFMNSQESFSLSVKGRYAVNHSQMRLNGVKQGLGIGIFHDFVVKDAIDKQDVVQVLPDWHIKSSYHGSIIMQYAQTRYMPTRLRVFIDFMMTHLSTKLDPTENPPSQ